MKNWDPPELGAPVLAMEKVLHREKRRAEGRGNETRTEVTGKRKREEKASAERRR
jgi:hypothetical protein